MEIEIKEEHIYQNSSSEYWPYNDLPVLAPSLTYEEFFSLYMKTNYPCIIKGITKHWESSKLWVRDQRPNIDYLRQKYGDCKVMIYNCKESYYNSHKTEECEFKEYLKYFEACLDDHSTEELKYLKDWHLKNSYKEDNFYKTPIYFSSDWLNEYLVENLEDDYRFVYMGPAGTWTPFHCDVFTSYSWSANICGKKRWILLPPGEEIKLKDKHGNLPFDISDKMNGIKYYEVTQNAGEVIFVPSGWFHQVWNLEDTISINHNWVNGCNIDSMWQSISKYLELVKNEIQDCSDMENFLDQCQVMLKASYGIDFKKFLSFLSYIGHQRLKILSNEKPLTLFNSYSIGRNHALFDLYSIDKVLQKLTNHEDFPKLGLVKDEVLHNKIFEVLNTKVD